MGVKKMPRVGATIYDVLLSCPGDVVDLIEIVEKCCNDFNRSLGEINNIKIELKHWSTDGYPQSGGRPQDLLNNQFINKSDACIALFGNRFGTPTDEYESGTEEEIEGMMKSGKQVFLYFIERSVDPGSIDVDQLAKVRLFKEKYQNRGLFWSVKSDDEFRRLLLNHITLHFLNQISEPQANELTTKIPKLAFQTRDNNEKAKVMHSEYLDSKILKKKEDEIEEVLEIISSIKINNVFDDKKDDDIKLNKNESSMLKLSSELGAAVKKFEGFSNTVYSEVVVDEETKETVTNYCTAKGIELPDDIWCLGGLEEGSNMLTSQFNTEKSYKGSDESKRKYELIIDAWHRIFEYNEYLDYFMKLDKLLRIEFIIANDGTSYDEDIDVKIKLPLGCLVAVDDLPVPGFTLIEDINNSNFIKLFFSGQKNDEIEEYSDYPVTPSFEFDNVYYSLPFNQPSHEKLYKREKDKYLDALNDLFCYEQYQNDEFDILTFNISYLKQNTKMYLPTHLVIREIPTFIEYEIRSKHIPDVISGKVEIQSNKL